MGCSEWTVEHTNSKVPSIAVQSCEVFARASESELNSTVCRQVGGVYSCAALRDSSDDRIHQQLILSTGVLIRDLFNESDIGIAKVIDSLFKSAAGKIGNYLESCRSGADIHNSQAPN